MRLTPLYAVNLMQSSYASFSLKPLGNVNFFFSFFFLRSFFFFPRTILFIKGQTTAILLFSCFVRIQFFVLFYLDG